MSGFSSAILPIMGALIAAWTITAAYVIWRALQARAKAEVSLRATSRLALLMENAPAISMLVRSDGRLDASDRLGRWLGLSGQPQHLSDLYGGQDGGLAEASLTILAEHIRAAQKTGAQFEMALPICGSGKQLIARGGPAEAQVFPSGAALIWLFDASDIAARMDAETQAREEAEDAFLGVCGLIEAAPFPMWHRAPDLRLSLVNKAYVDAVGAANADETIAQGVELIEPVAGVNAISAAAQAVSSGQANERELTTTMFGARRRVRVVDVPLGQAGVAGYAIDIQDAAELAQDFAQFESAQRNMLDNMSAAVAQFDAERGLSFTNLPFRRLFGMKDEWLAEQPNFARLIDRMREAGRAPEVRDPAEWRGALEQWFISAETQEDNWHLPDGSHIRVVGIPVPDGGLLMIFEDRTEEVKLASSRDTLLRVRAATFNNLFEAIAVFSSDGRLNIWNNKFASVWQVEEEKLAEHPRMDSFMSAISGALKRPGQISSMLEKLRLTMSDRRQKTGHIEMKTGRNFEYGCIPLPDGNVLLTMLDVTDSKQMELALRERNEALSEASEIKNRFLANMGYELRTPLTSISGFAELLKAGIGGQLPAQARGYVDNIHEASGRLSAQIEAIMDFSQSQAGSLPIAKKLQPIDPIVRGYGDEWQAKAAAKGLALRLDLKPSIGSAACDARRLGQALSLILENAVNYTGEGGEILLYADGVQRHVRIVVSDNGPGMDNKQQARAFDGFARSVEGKGKAGGLGLPLARMLIEAHGGTLELVSQKGQGTMVTILVPRA